MKRSEIATRKGLITRIVETMPSVCQTISYLVVFSKFWELDGPRTLCQIEIHAIKIELDQMWR